MRPRTNYFTFDQRGLDVVVSQTGRHHDARRGVCAEKAGQQVRLVVAVGEADILLDRIGQQALGRSAGSPAAGEQGRSEVIRLAGQRDLAVVPGDVLLQQVLVAQPHLAGAVLKVKDDLVVQALATFDHHRRAESRDVVRRRHRDRRCIGRVLDRERSDAGGGPNFVERQSVDLARADVLTQAVDLDVVTRHRGVELVEVFREALRDVLRGAANDDRVAA